MSRCPRQPKLSQVSIPRLSGEAPELAAEPETEKSLANTENLHNYCYKLLRMVRDKSLEGKQLRQCCTGKTQAAALQQIGVVQINDFAL